MSMKNCEKKMNTITRQSFHLKRKCWMWQYTIIHKELDSLHLKKISHLMTDFEYNRCRNYSNDTYYCATVVECHAINMNTNMFYNYTVNKLNKIWLCISIVDSALYIYHIPECGFKGVTITSLQKLHIGLPILFLECYSNDFL